MKASIWSVILVALLGMPASATAPNSEFRCQGLFVRDASRASFIKAFGPANVAREDVFMAGDTVPMTVVFPRDRRRWRDMASERGIAKVIIGGGSTWSVGGIVIGASIVDVEKLNGRPFKILSADGDIGYELADWQGGHLAVLPGGCTVGPEFVIDDSAYHLFEKEISDDLLLSSGAGLRAAKPVVGMIVVSFPD